MSDLRHRKGKHEHLALIRPQRRMSFTELESYRLLKRPRFFENDRAQWWRGGRMPQRDAQRQKAYIAERKAARYIEHNQTFENIAQVARYVRSIMETKWFQRRFPVFRECVVEYLPGSSTCKGGPRLYGTQGEVRRGFIRMSTWGMGQEDDEFGGEMVVLHELAHAVLPGGHGHDRRWARTYLELVGFGMGSLEKKTLQGYFQVERVKVSPFRKVKTTEDQKYRLAANRP